MEAFVLRIAEAGRKQGIGNREQKMASQCASKLASQRERGGCDELFTAEN
jgi:hypothetical protein